MLLTRSRPMGRRSQRREGTAVVEFAVVAPFIVFATMGMIEITRGIQVKHTLSDAARNACRLAILPGADKTTVDKAATDILSDNGMNGADATIAILVNGQAVDLKTARQGDPISLSVSIPVSKVGWISPIFLPGRSIQSETLVMMRQR